MESQLILFYFGDRNYEIAETDEDWRRVQRSVPVFWDENNDCPDVNKTLARLYVSSRQPDESRFKRSCIAARIEPHKLYVMGEKKDTELITDHNIRRTHAIIDSNFWIVMTI